MQHHYHYVGMTDLSKIREQLRDRLNDKRDPTESTLHLHPQGAGCEDQEHEIFAHEVKVKPYIPIVSVKGRT